MTGIARSLVICWCVALLTACGGGGGATPAPPLAISIGGPTTAYVGELVRLDGGASLGAGASGVNYQWLIADPTGAPVIPTSPWGQYATVPIDLPGNYTAALSATFTVNGVSTSATAKVLTLAASYRTPLATATTLSDAKTLAAQGAALLSPDASSPTVTPGVANAGSLIPGSVLIPWDSGLFRYNGRMRLAGTAFPDDQLGSNQAVSYSPFARSGSYLTIDFVTNAASFEVLQKGLGGSDLRIAVNGRLANTSPVTYPADGNFYLTKVDFGSSATRSIRLLAAAPYFGGVRIGASDSLQAPTQSPPLRVIFMGDSITEGPAGQNFPTSYAPLVADVMGWQDAWISGVGSTGYLAAPAPKLTFRQRYADDIKAFGPDILIIAGGLNDASFADADIQTEAGKLFDQIQADLPNTLVYVLGPWGSVSRVRPSLNAAIKAAVGTRPNFTWVPNYDNQWITGSGNTGAPAGDGNADIYISADNSHPTPAGIQYLAGQLEMWLKGQIGQ